ncbi:hypothetical protein M0R45_013948 [Rubus argutus]|uniref:Uncharacterized protein n=1 Tax=Rubus argutus TaxID=59490 RepID=A0AAW1XK85_RUBAR
MFENTAFGAQLFVCRVWIELFVSLCLDEREEARRRARAEPAGTESASTRFRRYRTSSEPLSHSSGHATDTKHSASPRFRCRQPASRSGPDLIRRWHSESARCSRSHSTNPFAAADDIVLVRLLLPLPFFLFRFRCPEFGPRLEY